MAVFQLKIASWDKIFEFSEKKRGKKFEFKVGDYVIIKVDSHTDIAKIVDIVKEKKHEEAIIIRKANQKDFEKLRKKEKRKSRILKRASEIVEKSSLPMKLVDVHLSLDGGNLIFAFTAPGKIDFRQLVKDLSKEFHRSIRLHQINPREEMRIFLNIGSCGRPLCCLSFLKSLGGVKTDFIQEQQLTHRGIDRLSGPCGRLKCCLMYEREFYLEQIKKFPQIGTKVKIEDKEGEVVGLHLLKESIDLKIGQDTMIEVPIEKIKKYGK